MIIETREGFQDTKSNFAFYLIFAPPTFSFWIMAFLYR